jgi:hypothetical protein
VRDTFACSHNRERQGIGVDNTYYKYLLLVVERYAILLPTLSLSEDRNNDDGLWEYYIELIVYVRNGDRHSYYTRK